MEPRWIIVLAANLLMMVMVAQINHYLAAWSLYLYAGGLLVLFPAFHLTLRHGMKATVLTALFVDAAMPVPYGTSLFLFCAAHLALNRLRSRFPRQEDAVGLMAALAANLIIFLALSAFLASGHPPPAAYWHRLIADLAVSQGFVLLAGGWFLALQRKALLLYGINLEEEQREAH
jgi:hypothetical protein